MRDLEYMDIAVEIAKKGVFPYGAIIVKDGKIIGRSDDDTLINKGMFTHAELSAIESASRDKNLYGELKGATLYTTCEPCMMCMGAILYEQFDRLVIGATLQDSNDYYAKEMVVDVEILAKYANNDIKIEKGLRRDEIIEILKSRVNPFL